ncbi:UDP-N-acetylmuramate dehydrogenase [Conexibacter sp. JD483]|uniref:UDP-N-acetylmuramate dehydrogenase n=1 Tax=unclassified Conexibacter TaxID=2627773 RepID=UPI002716F1B6|nr:MULTISPECIES: UDP-N-acetylmuramate dehydrogenase [unclassified Conexibacter]MDO8188879.1 UDP-N-acetylmuramate dehydrogenase [Conexibacter sp. CPCC 205706]MDO8201669.1 UDP-N-acetylmuramate dehydrogenase [Conexibacter sp. CPCC 205762]MDR9372131.1 UDP-N-acetylmuramate dehydrogenase [Conexibacter sp. JD483]
MPTPPAEQTATPLAPLTTLQLGGPARRLVEVDGERELVATVRELDAAGEPLLVLAGGSNVVIADAGFDGTVVLVRSRGIEHDGDELIVQAGEPWDGVVEQAVEAGLAGIEALSGIPGSAGATPIQNVGAYGQDVSQTIVAVRVLDRADGSVRELPAAACGFRYRTSAFKGRDDRIVVGVRFGLARRGSAASAGGGLTAGPSAGGAADGGTSPGGRGARALGAPVAYAELARTLGVEVGGRAPLGEVRAAVLALRRGKGMVVDPADPDSVSAGSFFTNPILDAAAYERLAAATPGDRPPPAYPEPDGRVKTSAAWLIEHAGFTRGTARGSVAISSKHTLALTNRGGATTAQLVAFAREIAAGVEQAFGVALVPEPVFVGHAW